MSEQPVPLELIEQILQGNCALFLGTGSVAPDFTEQLVLDLIEHCGYRLLDRELAKVAEHYEAALRRHSLTERVCGWIERQEVGLSPLDKAIARLPVNTVITTRTDLMLEEAYRQAQRLVVKVVRDEEVAFGDSQKVLLVKLHGCISQKDSLILTERDHFAVFRKRPIVADLVRMLYATKTVLYLGQDLDSIHFKLLQREVSEQVGRFVRRGYVVWQGADDYRVRLWRNDNIAIVDRLPLEFLRELGKELSKRKPSDSVAKAKAQIAYGHPYKFLDHFEARDAALFFGRQTEANILSKRILAHRLMLLFGGSGVGKTSLIKAGAIPELFKLGAFPIYSRCLDSPLDSLEKAVCDAVQSETGVSISPEDDGENRLLGLLLRCQQAVGKPAVLFVDQFEELFRQPVETQRELSRILARCVDADALLDLRLVISVREDFFPELDSLRENLPQIYRNVFRLQNLSEKAATEAVVGPLNWFDVKFEDKLIELLIADLRSEGVIAPAQLQIVCSRLYEQFGHEKIVTAEHYAEIGEARAILAAYLDEVLARFSIASRQTARQILQALVSSQETKKLMTGPEIARQLRVGWQQIAGTVSQLESYRLLRRVETTEEPKYELVHEYIVSEIWKRLTEHEAKLKEVQDLLESEARGWTKYRAPIPTQKLDAIFGCWRQLVLDDSHLELLFRSSIAFGRLKQWGEIADTLGAGLIPLYSRLIHDTDSGVYRMAVVALSRLGVTGETEQILTGTDYSIQMRVRNVLRQLEAGRPPEDFSAEITEPEWRSKSVWNAGSIVGIDFGTTSSAVAVFRNGRPVLIPNREGSKFTPSVVAFTKRGEVVVGTPALLQAASNPVHTVFSVKRHMGTEWHITVNDITYTPVDIAALIIASLKEDAEKYLERRVRETVISVPAYFNIQQRSAVREAAEKAGFEVLRLVAEPTAAALAHGLGTRRDEKIAVYDLGGGTFDISILDTGEGVFQVLAVNGDVKLGGDDFDEQILRYLLSEFREKNGIDLSTDRTALVRLKEAVERAKIALSGLDTVNIYVPYIHADSSGIRHMDVDLTRKRFEEATLALVERSLQSCRKALDDARIKTTEIDELVLVGLSTKIPLVRDSVSRLFGKEPRRGVDPDEAVAAGVAIQAGVLEGRVRDTLLLDATPLTLSVETLGGVATPMIERNSTIPTKRTQLFTTTKDDQTEALIHVVHGEHPMARDNESLGRLMLDGIPPAPCGTPLIEVTFTIEPDGALFIEAKDKATGKTVSRKATPGRDTATLQSSDNQEIVLKNLADTDRAKTQSRLLREQSEG